MSDRTDETVRPYRIDVPQAVLDDLRERLARTRWPDQLADAGWDYGAELSSVQALCAYWRDRFDWRAAEARLNRFPQFVTDIDGETVHFLHVRSPHPGALPLVLTHGWPGSIAEFDKIVDLLTDPVAHGGRAEDAFHVVAPSIPGYGFSGPTHAKGWDTRRVAQAWGVLMARLGYDRYGAQGGDWGSMISNWMPAVDPDHVIGVHLNMVIAAPLDPANPMLGVEPDETEGVLAMAGFQDNETGYQAIQGTKPQTLAYGLTDSPAGLAGWILEKFQRWSDCDGDVLSRFTYDELLTNITIYWVTGTINSSTRLYYESLHKSRRTRVPQVPHPFGCALFPRELYRTPRAWAAKRLNVTRWTRMPRGGHFAAMEEPALLADDIRAFFATVR